MNGVLHHPGSSRPPVIIGCHGLFSSGESPKQMALAEACNAAGMAFFRFDHRGIGRSEGDFNQVTSLEGRSRDLIDAVNTMRQREDIGDRFGLFGSSYGGAVVLYSAGLITNVSAIVCVAAPVVIPNSKTAMDAVMKSSQSGRPDPEFTHERLTFDIEAGLPHVHHVLIFHGESDEIIPVSHARRIYQHSSEPKRLIIQKDGDHRMSLPAHQREFIREAVEWYENGLKES